MSSSESSSVIKRTGQIIIVMIIMLLRLKGRQHLSDRHHYAKANHAIISTHFVTRHTSGFGPAGAEGHE